MTRINEVWTYLERLHRPTALAQSRQQGQRDTRLANTAVCPTDDQSWHFHGLKTQFSKV
jgi:hypothetical protein